MAIRPPSDIVLDVARAADPIRSRMAAEKLARLSATSPADGDLFADLLGEGSPSGEGAEAAAPEATLSDLRTQLALMEGGSSLSPRAKAGRALEAFVLQTFISSMMPKNERIFGKGTAGEVWRSMMSEQIARQIADAGGVGIARALTPRAPDIGGGGSMPGLAALVTSAARPSSTEPGSAT